MNSVNFITFNFIIVVFLNSCYGFVELPLVENNDMLMTETIIRQTVNNLFDIFKLDKALVNSNLYEYSTLHKYFLSLSLQDLENLNKITTLTKVNKSKINETDLITIINDVLEEDNSETAKNETEMIDDDRDVTIFIENFLKNLQQSKEIFNVDNTYVNVNKDILLLLEDQGMKLSNNSEKIETDLFKSDENDLIHSDIEFWEPDGRRIFKGDRTKIKHYPFMATIQIFNNFHCAGSIIKSDLIITASSCLQLAWNNRLFRENPAFLSVRVGSSFYNGGGEVIPVLEIYFHPGYNPKNLRNNICILRLSRQLKFRRRERKVKKIDFDRNDSNLPLNTPGITVVGWGAKEHSPVIGNPWKNIISSAVLDVYPLRDCQDVYSKEYVSHKNFCAGFLSRGGGACNRDVGGPGIVDGKLMGVISFGSPVCGMPDTPTVFTKLGYYTDWIEEIMEQDVPVSKKRTTLKPLFNSHTVPVTYRPPKPTTFKIPPITGKTMTPIPISQIDSQLRIMDENVFKDFLKTMLNSKEISEYKDILKDYEVVANDITVVDEAVTDTINPVTEFQDIASNTQIIDASADEESNKSDFETGFTVMDQENKSNADNIDKEILEIINDVDLERIVKEEVIVSPKKVKDKGGDKVSETEVKNTYLSDEEDNNEIDKIKNDNDGGMSIPSDIFEDLTRAKEDENGVLAESVLYKLLSEVIREEVENINVLI